MSGDVSTQYANDVNLRARQRFWEHQQPGFDIVGWAMGLAGVRQRDRVLDVGCGNGLYLARLREREIDAVGCDLSRGMLAAARPHPLLVNGDAQCLPFATAAFDVVLAPHMLYHVPDPAVAAREMRRVLRPGGRCIAVTNSAAHMRSMRELVEAAVRKTAPGWVMRNPSTHTFSLENGADQLRQAFASVEVVRPDNQPRVVVRDAGIVGDYVASLASAYQHEVDRPWRAIAEDVRAAVAEKIAIDGEFVVLGDGGAFICT